MSMTTRLAFSEKPNAKSSHGWFKEMAVALVAVFALNVSARVSDGMYFDLKCVGDTNGNGRLDLNEAVNAMAVGAADGGASIYGNPVNNPAGHEQIGFTEETAWRKFYYRASPVRNVLRIPQSYSLSDDGLSIYAYQDAVVFTNSGAMSSCINGRTMFIRFYWEGKSYPEVSARQEAFIVSDSWNWSNATGYALTLSQQLDGTFGLQVWVGKKNNYVMRGASVAVVNSNEWYDVAVRLDGNGDTATARTTYGHRGTLDVWNGTSSFANALVPSSDGKLVIGAENYNNTSSAKCSLSSAPPKTFRGRIAELKIWNRSLSDDELGAVFRTVTGESVSVGSVNGSSDEFGSAPVEVFDPRTMEWGCMRKELTAEHPSLKIETAFMPEEAEIGKTFLVTPVLSDVASCDVECLVNGKSVAAATLTDGVEMPLRIRNRDWKAGANGKVNLELRRKGDLSGKLGIDAFSLGGSWQLGGQDGGYGDFSVESDPDALANYYVGDADTSNHLRRATFEVGNSNAKTNIFLNFYCPAAMRNVESVFTVRLANKANPTAAAIPFVFTVNRELTFNRSLAKGDSATMVIPEGTLNAGYNFISVEHHAEGTGVWAGMDFYRLQFQDPLNGMVLLIR